MTKKILRSILAVAITVVLASIAIILTSLYDYFTAAQSETLKAQLNMAAAAVENEGVDYLKALDLQRYRITLIDNDGTVLFDTKSDAEKMENHLDRKEVSDAIKNGSGKSVRYSSTLTEKTIYFAKLLSNGYVLRISEVDITALSLIMGMMQPISLVIVLMFALSMFLAYKLSNRIVKPLNELNLDEPLKNDVYEELTPLLKHIDKQQKKIKEQIYELTSKESEFNTITESMSEGLILLNNKGIIISINRSAKRIFDVDDNCIGKDFLTAERNREVNKAVQNAYHNGHSEICIEKEQKQYRLHISRIDSENKSIGLVLLAIDITAQASAENLRREFSANVSHELKTPLQSIIGSAEIIENGIVKPEDLPRFAGHIRSEASRLVTLINDIIRLSQLDEGSGINTESVNLYTAAKEALKMLEYSAKQKNISVELSGENAYISGSNQLVYDIVFNLCDNAIKYNNNGGKVSVKVTKSDGNASFTVTDNGVGISKEDCERIFERFYRVDKSHSKETGGTGLGLSIVKHAVQYLNGKINLESELGKGTSITVSFPDTSF